MPAMMNARRLRPWLALLALLQPPSAVGAAEPALAVRVAALLARGEQQAARGREARGDALTGAGEGAGGGAGLAATVAALEAAGAVPLDRAADPVPAWRARLAGGGDGRRPAPPPWRGRTLGAAYQLGQLAPGARYELRQSFLAGQVAEVAVRAVGPGRLALAVSSPQGTPLCRTGPAGRALSCQWLPAFSGAAVITLTSVGQHGLRYVLVVR